MSHYKPEPNYNHGDPPRIGIILANLGTPDAPDAKSLRKYLGQFLMDRRVVEIPRFIWCWILHCIILVIRPAASAKKYQQVWTKEGSPLLVNAKKQMSLLKKQLEKDYKEPIEVQLGMSYGNPINARCIQKTTSRKTVLKLFYYLSILNMQHLQLHQLWTAYGESYCEQEMSLQSEQLETIMIIQRILMH